MFIQPEQIRAARAMLDWSQQDLADAAGVSKDTVKNYELSHNKPNSKTLAAIEGALATAGIEFLSDGGVRPLRERIRTIQGVEGLRLLMDLLYKAAETNPTSPVIISNVQEDLFNKWLGDFTPYHRNRMMQLEGIEPWKVILAKGKQVLEPVPYLSCRYIDQTYFGDVSLYCFDKHIAILELSEHKCSVHVIENELLNRTFMKLLNLMWVNAE